MSRMEFRRFWLFALGKHALKALILSTLLVAGALVRFPSFVWLAAFVLVPLAWFGYHYLVWRRTAWIMDAERKEVVIQEGIIKQSEERIPLSFAPRIHSSQGLLGRVLNFGDVELSSFGKPALFHQVGDFRAFKAALTSQCQVFPKRRSLLLLRVVMAGMTGLLTLTQAIFVGIVWLFRISKPFLAKGRDQFLQLTRSVIRAMADHARETFPIRRADVSPFSTSYGGFLAFCCDFVLGNGHQLLLPDYTRPDKTRKYYPGGLSREVADVYFSILCRSRIVISRANGHREWVLRRQIRNLLDVRRRIPQQVFEKTGGRYVTLNLVEQLTLPGIEREPSLDQAAQNG